MCKAVGVLVVVGVIVGFTPSGGCAHLSMVDIRVWGNVKVKVEVRGEVKVSCQSRIRAGARVR